MRKLVLTLLCTGSMLSGFQCSSPQLSTVMVRPASCSHDLQFATAASLDELLAFADKMQKPIFMHFTVPTMDQCMYMEERVFKTDGVASYYNLHFINYKVDVAKQGYDQYLADRYGVTRFPTQVIVDGKGKVMHRHEGPATPNQMLETAYVLVHGHEPDAISLGTR